METENKLQTLNAEIISETSLSIITKAEIDTQILTAKNFPRSIKTFMDKAMSMATLSESIAASCNYAVPRAGKSLEGKSIRLAEIVLSSYGNVRAGARVISNDGKMITAQGICHDLETNSCITKEVQRKITNKSGQTFTEDMQIVTGNAACSIALRNAIFACIPSALTDEVYDKAKQVARGTAETLVARRIKAIEWFKEQKVTEKQICEILEVKKIEDIDLDKLSTLSGMRTLVRNGEGSIKDLFSKPTSEPKSKEDVEKERLTLLLSDCKTVVDVELLQEMLPDVDVKVFNDKKAELKTKK